MGGQQRGSSGWVLGFRKQDGRPVGRLRSAARGQGALGAQKAPISVAQERHSRAAPTLSAGPCAAPSAAGAA